MKNRTSFPIYPKITQNIKHVFTKYLSQVILPQNYRPVIHKINKLLYGQNLRAVDQLSCEHVSLSGNGEKESQGQREHTIDFSQSGVWIMQTLAQYKFQHNFSCLAHILHSYIEGSIQEICSIVFRKSTSNHRQEHFKLNMFYFLKYFMQTK